MNVSTLALPCLWLSLIMHSEKPKKEEKMSWDFTWKIERAGELAQTVETDLGISGDIALLS